MAILKKKGAKASKKATKKVEEVKVENASVNSEEVEIQTTLNTDSLEILNAEDTIIENNIEEVE